MIENKSCDKCSFSEVTGEHFTGHREPSYKCNFSLPIWAEDTLDGEFNHVENLKIIAGNNLGDGNRCRVFMYRVVGVHERRDDKKSRDMNHFNTKFWHFGLFDSDGNEVNYPLYKRVMVENSANNFRTVDRKTIENVSLIEWAQNTADMVLCSGFFLSIEEDSDQSKAIFRGRFDSPLFVCMFESPRFNPGAMKITFDDGELELRGMFRIGE
jgi:hypothetical protein